MDQILDTDKTFCSILFDVMAGEGVKDVVCSPGSRNAPLLLAAAARKELRKHMAVDERAASFMALGMSIVSQKPVALACTSGTALLNYGPAIAEAYYQSIPLVVVSADRPQQWIDQDDSQTLRQFEAFSNYVKKSYQLPALGNNDREMQWYANRIANDAMIEARSGRKGPVHINISLGEPLGGKALRQFMPVRTIEMVEADILADKEILKSFSGMIAGSRVMFVAGFLPPSSRMQKAVKEFCSLPGVVAMTETLSNLHLDELACCVDSVLTAFPEEVLDDMVPDIVISVGGALVSRKLKEYLRRNGHRCQHWSIGKHITTTDCFQSLTKRIETDPARTLMQLANGARKFILNKGCGEAEAYSKAWERAKREAMDAKKEYVETAPWSELRIFKHIIGLLPSNYNLFLSNGTSIRYAQLLSDKLPHASYCNRGVSGIDGCTSTSIGCCKAYGGMTLLVTGDMSMAYDIGSLGLPGIPDRMRIIVIDNQGGGIFRFIPSTSSLDELEEYFCLRPSLPLKELAQGYGWEYLEADNEDSFIGQLDYFFSPGKRKIMKVACDGKVGANVLKEYMSVWADMGKTGKI